MALLGILKKADKLRKRVDKDEKDEPVDKSIFRIGVYGHKGVGKTVYFTIAYNSSKKSPDFEIMALGETQEILEEKFNLMRGRGMDLMTGQKISGRRFPPLSTGQQKLNFEVRVGRNTIIPINTIDYSGELIYIDARGDIKQNLIDFFKSCECVLFFIDPDAIQNEGERSNRIAAFTDLIGQLSGLEKKLKIPVGLVVSKADEMPGFKSAEQSVLIGKGSGHIRALNFSGFLRGVLKQRMLSGRPDWKKELELMLNRLESFFKPLINRTMDYQVFFISSTGNSPDFIADQRGDKIKIPPEDLRPMGVHQPLIWAVNRITAYRRAAVYKNILKWTFMLVALFIDLVAFGHIYNQIKVKELHRKVANVSRAIPNANMEVAKYYRTYSDNFMVRTFFGDYSRLAANEYKHFSTLGSQRTQKDLYDKFKMALEDVDGQITGLAVLRSDSIRYDSALSAIETRIDTAQAIINDIAEPGIRNDMAMQVGVRQERLKSVPTGGQLSAAQNLKKEYDELKAEFNENLATLNYDYLLDPNQFPAKLKTFKETVLGADRENQLAINYSRYIQNYLNVTAAFQTGVLIPFRVEGAPGGENGFSVVFMGASEAPQGDITDGRTDLQFRVPVVSSQQITIAVRRGGKDPVIESYQVNSGYSILRLNGQRLPFTDTSINIKFYFDLGGYFFPLFKDKL